MLQTRSCRPTVYSAHLIEDYKEVSDSSDLPNNPMEFFNSTTYYGAAAHYPDLKGKVDLHSRMDLDATSIVTDTLGVLRRLPRLYIHPQYGASADKIKGDWAGSSLSTTANLKIGYVLASGC